MQIKNITKVIEEVFGNELKKMNFKEKKWTIENGRYTWVFEQENYAICILLNFGRYLHIKFSLTNISSLEEEELVSFLEESTLEEKIYGFEFSDEEDLRNLLLRLNPIIMEQGIPWMEKQCIERGKINRESE